MSIISVAELQRRVAIFIKVLPGNVADGKPWTTVEVSRVMLKHCVNRIFNPSVEHDKHDIQHHLRIQYYSDIKIKAQGRAAEVAQANRQRKLNNFIFGAAN